MQAVAIERLRVGGKIIICPGTEGLELHYLYRAMAFWGEGIEELEKPPAAVRCTKDLVEKALLERSPDLFPEVELVFLDTTSLYFEGQGGEIGKRGHNKDHRPDLKQMAVGMAVDVQGCAMRFEMWPGNTADVTTLAPIVKRMRERFRPRELTVVADRGRVSEKTLVAFEGSDLIGAKVRLGSGVETFRNSRYHRVIDFTLVVRGKEIKGTQ